MGPVLLVDHVVATDAALVGLQVTMLGDGGFTVAGVTAVELEQETYHCYMRCLADAAAPGLADELCAALAADTPPAPSPELLARAGAPLPGGVYDVLVTSLAVTAVAPAGVRLSCPASYMGDEWGIDVRRPDEPSQRRYGYRFEQTTPGCLYRASVGRVGVIVLPLARTLDPARVEHYARQLERGGRPTVLAFGCYGSERSAALLVLDGHHKLAAAARTGHPISLVAFVSSRLIDTYWVPSRAEHPLGAQPILAAVRRNVCGDTELRDEIEQEALLERWRAQAEARRAGRRPSRA